MDALSIVGGRRLRGRVIVSGSKNAALPMMAASILSAGISVLRGVPELADIKTMSRLLEQMGAKLEMPEKDVVCFEFPENASGEAPYELVRTMRASILVLGPLVARLGRAQISLPGGCAIGSRPIDQHLMGLEKLGAKVTLAHGNVDVVASRLVGAEIKFTTPSVGATENLMMAATLARGVTVLDNCACEPEVVDLAGLLVSMGAEINGAGSSRIVIHGSESLSPFDYRVMADRIEFGTFMVAGALCGDGLQIDGGKLKHQRAFFQALEHAGVEIKRRADGHGVEVTRATTLRAVSVNTAPYPGFATDMQAQWMALMSVAAGRSTICETIFENRFMHVAELKRMGADIQVRDRCAHVCGVAGLSGAKVMATDLRASASLVLAGLVADGETTIRRIYHLDRGYQRIEEKLRGVGAAIERYKDD